MDQNKRHPLKIVDPNVPHKAPKLEAGSDINPATEAGAQEASSSTATPKQQAKKPAKGARKSAWSRLEIGLLAHTTVTFDAGYADGTLPYDRRAQIVRRFMDARRAGAKLPPPATDRSAEAVRKEWNNWMRDLAKNEYTQLWDECRGEWEQYLAEQERLRTHTEEELFQEDMAHYRARFNRIFYV